MKRGAVASPVTDSERADILDALRGFALLGIFVSHIPDFSGYSFQAPVERAALDSLGVNGPLSPVLDFLIRGKFLSLFSLLFGIGFAVQLESAARRGADFALHFSRRLAVLLIIGLAHASLWYGDILKDYALIGFAMLVTARWSIGHVAWAVAGVLALRALWPLLVALAFASLAPAGVQSSPGASFGDIALAFGGVDLGAMFIANAELLQLKALQMVYDGRAISILGMFLLGSLIGRLRLYRDLNQHRALFRKTFWICAPVGVVGNAVLAPLHAATPDFPPTTQWVIEQALFAIAVPALTLAYASGFALLWARGSDRLLRALAPPGRMAVTTYVSQTLIGIGLFYGIGLGLHGQVGLAAGTLAAIAIFAMQCAASAIWLRHFRFGPLEWIWRRATYGKPIPMLRPANVEVGIG